MARALIVGCGCRGRELGQALAEAGWAVRGTSRRREGLDAIEAAGIEAAEADPYRVGTLVELLGDVTVVVWALGSAAGDAEEVAALHEPRLETFLEKLVDTPVRGLVYEASGSLPADLLAAGRDLVEAASERWRIPVEIVAAEEPTEPAATGRLAFAVQALVRRGPG